MNRLSNRCRPGLQTGASGQGAIPEWLDRDVLADDEPLLRQVFGLLVQAHYRTRPFDLRNLLDGPGLAVAVVRLDGMVVGVLLVSEEGGFSAELSRDVWLGERRPHGHLLAQALAAHVGLPHGATVRAGRVMRVAVHPDYRRQGIATSLLECFRQRAVDRGLDLIGTSFGVTPGLLRFWYCNGYAPAHMGVRRDAASGAHSAVLVQGLTERGHTLCLEALQAYRRSLPAWVRDYLRDLEPELLWPLLAPGAFVEAPDERCWDEAMAFACASRSPESSLASLIRLAWHGGPMLASRGVPVHAFEPVLVRLMQGHDWDESARRLGVSGRGEVLRVLRTACQKLLLAVAPEVVQARANELQSGSQY